SFSYSCDVGTISASARSMSVVSFAAISSSPASIKFLLFSLGDPRDVTVDFATLNAPASIERVLRLEAELRTEPVGDGGRDGRAGRSSTPKSQKGRWWYKIKKECGIGAAPPAVKTPPRPSLPPHVPTPSLPVPTRPPSPPRAPSPSASVLSSKRPISPGSSSSGPSVAAVSVCGSEDSSMALDYEAVTPRPGSPNEPLDNAQIVENLHETIDNLFNVISLFSKSQWKEELLKDSPGLMDNELEDIHNHFLHNMKHTAHLVRPFLPAVEAPAVRVSKQSTLGC
ncbi:hypothetical protein AGABI1DRAFT_95950, partial [Agaricus bisporus var. burnettii JB137-S8]